FAGSTGYGYGDAGRDKLDEVFASLSGAQDALCRAQFMSGTHALTVALFGLLRPNDTLLCAMGAPYDTMLGVIGIGGENSGSLAEFGVKYTQAELLNGGPDLHAISEKAKNARVVLVQRSRGYSARRALSCADIEQITLAVKKSNPKAIVLVDNCYGEFVEMREPTECGAELIVGSLIKNAGGAVAQTGGYIAGKAELVELCSYRLTAPGTGREIGCNPAGLRELYLGLYLAPGITAEALKSSHYASELFAELGYAVSPSPREMRGDIVTAITLGSASALEAACGAIQRTSPVDSFARPEAWEMPGYDDKVIMAAGAFTGGSSIELSCDAPLRAPYTVYCQGGISLAASRLAYLRAADAVQSRKAEEK
ncbi:MAG: methionine gamma-lyase family protein, partial [Oscillospiraceae bacterium]